MADLKNCPFCGDKIFLDSRYETLSQIDTTVRCYGCGVTFSYTQDFANSVLDRVAINASFEEVWNRRADA